MSMASRVLSGALMLMLAAFPTMLYSPLFRVGSGAGLGPHTLMPNTLTRIRPVRADAVVAQAATAFEKDSPRALEDPLGVYQGSFGRARAGETDSHVIGNEMVTPLTLWQPRTVCQPGRKTKWPRTTDSDSRQCKSTHFSQFFSSS